MEGTDDRASGDPVLNRPQADGNSRQVAVFVLTIERNRKTLSVTCESTQRTRAANERSKDRPCLRTFRPKESGRLSRPCNSLTMFLGCATIRDGSRSKKGVRNLFNLNLDNNRCRSPNRIGEFWVHPVVKRNYALLLIG